VALTPDEREFLTLGFDNGECSIRNLADNSQTWLDVDAPEADVGFFSPDGRLFGIASSMCFASVWNTATWKPAATLGNFLNGVHGLAFSPDSKRLAIADHNKEAVRLCDTESWQDVITLEGPSGMATTAFSPDGNTLVWGAHDALTVWRAPSWAEIKAAEAKEKALSRKPEPEPRRAPVPAVRKAIFSC
jgi:WD40 repeat protein